ncbi:MAG: hypothetical protein II811_04280 [Spirochaetaceae bacterium]|nr:hypothetical protein [Spirochaetaceae bacterium]
MKNIMRWIRLVLLLFVPIFCVAAVNFIGDTANLFHSSGNKEIALSILAGNATHGVGAMDERGVKRALIENLPDEVDTLAFGPSLVMCVNKSIVGTESFYNLGESAADYYDILAQFAFLELNHKKYKRVIFCADFDFLNKGRRSDRHLPFMSYAEFMLSVLHGKAQTSVKNSLYASFWNIKTVARQLVSIQYFQGATRVFYQLLRNRGKRFGLITKENADLYSYYENDASWVYDAKYRSSTVNDVVKQCRDYLNPKTEGNKLNDFCAVNEHLSDEVKETFSLLMEYLQNNGVEILIYFCPLPPTLYDLYDMDLRPLLPEADCFIRKYASDHNIRVTGSYNPYELGMSDADFYDARHVRREKLGVYFDFVR